MKPWFGDHHGTPDISDVEVRQIGRWPDCSEVKRIVVVSIVEVCWLANKALRQLVEALNTFSDLSPFTLFHLVSHYRNKAQNIHNTFKLNRLSHAILKLDFHNSQ